MPIAAPALDALRETLPEEFKDTKLNLSSVLSGENLSDAQAWGIALAAARFLRAPQLATALQSDLAAGLGDTAPAVISDATAAAGLMAMNTVYYRFSRQNSQPARAAQARLMSSKSTAVVAGLAIRCIRRRGGREA